jgi:hypothetical protein
MCSTTHDNNSKINHKIDFIILFFIASLSFHIVYNIPFIIKYKTHHIIAIKANHLIIACNIHIIEPNHDSTVHVTVQSAEGVEQSAHGTCSVTSIVISAAYISNIQKIVINIVIRNNIFIINLVISFNFKILKC